MSILELRSVSKTFGGLQVINDFSMTIEKSEIVSLIGPNGAGKTTAINLITGLYRPDSGDILLEGKSVVGMQPHQVTKKGIARTFQSLRLFLNMSVIENVMSAAYCRTHANLFDIVARTPRYRHEEARIRQKAEEKLSFFGERLVGFRFDQPVYSMSYANRRRVEIARAMITDPVLLLLDEPAAGMNPYETQEMTGLIGKIRDELGYTILVIEHDMKVVENISDRVVVLDHGVKIAEGGFAEVTRNPYVLEAYLGHGRTTIERKAIRLE
ncbi:MAG TPA: ABC transporter ATP-binding protein [Aggregatilineales bacterium]|nr:ABC transporter ATP-binding protein [Aggregatilineales bacterium]